MTDGLRKSHLRKAPQVGLSEVGLPEGNPIGRLFLLLDEELRRDERLPLITLQINLTQGGQTLCLL